MKLLLDEMLSPAIARELRARGYDVQAVAGHPDREPLPDPEVMMLARAERRAIVTSNVHDFRLRHADAVTPGGPGHFGMIFMAGNYRRTKSDIGRIIAAIEAVLTQYPGDDDLANGETWLPAADLGGVGSPQSE